MRVVLKIAPRTTVPVLLDGEAVVQGSSAIISYLDERFPATSLTPAGRAKEIQTFETELDRDVGESLRRMLYHRLLDDPAQVRYYFMHRSPFYQDLLFRAVYPVISGKIRAKYRIDDATFAESKARFEKCLDRLDAHVTSRPYFVGDQFSRADVTAASLLAFLCMPAEHPVPWLPVRDAQAAAVLDAYQDRPVTLWVKRMYQEHRWPHGRGDAAAGAGAGRSVLKTKT